MDLKLKIYLLILFACSTSVRMANSANSEMFRRQTEDEYDQTNQNFIDSGDYDDVEMLEDKLESYKHQFMEADEDNSGDIDIMELKRMLLGLGQVKTHLELKKTIAEVDVDNTGTISYNEFLRMRLQKRPTVLKLILMFEEKKKEKENS